MQYYLMVNLDKRQFLDGNALGQEPILSVMAFSGGNLMAAIALLLSSGNGRGGRGDYRFTGPTPGIIGSWAGDRIVLAGSYMDEGLYVPDDFDGNLYHYARMHYQDVSQEMLAVLTDVHGNWGVSQAQPDGVWRASDTPVAVVPPARRQPMSYPLQTVQSRAIEKVGYDGEKKCLLVVFQSDTDAVYEYRGVPEELYHQLLAHHSMGSYLHQHVIGKYPTEMLDINLCDLAA